MASLNRQPNDTWRILFYSPEGSRKTLRLGKVPKKTATSMLHRVESLLSGRTTGHKPTGELAEWLRDLDPKIHDRLVRCGLADPKDEQPQKPPGLTLSAHLDDFLLRHGPSKKPATRVVWGQVMRMLRDKMPEGIELAAVTKGHAKKFIDDLKAEGLASTTIHKRVGFARQFFEDAVDFELIDKNPFHKLKTSAPSAKSNVDVPRETIDVVMRHCDIHWKTIVALCRYGGLRCPSEVLSVTWDGIDWGHNRMSIPEPKVEHHEGRGVRSIPLFPELRKVLAEALELAPDGAVYVVGKDAYRKAAQGPGGWANANLRTQFLKVLKRAGVAPWARLFHSMRASRQTELEREFPRHVVCAWLGNSAAIAEKHYLLVTDADFAAAAEPKKAARKAAPLDAKAAP